MPSRPFVWLGDWGGTLVLLLGVYTAHVWARLALAGWSPPSPVPLFVLPLFDLVLSVLMCRAAVHPALGHAHRRSLALIASAFLLIGGAHVVARGSHGPAESWFSDGMHVLALAFLLGGMVSFPHRRLTPHQRTTFWLDVVTVMIVSGVPLWSLVLRPLAAGSRQDLAGLAFALVYPTADLVLLFGLMFILFRCSEPRMHVALLALAAGTSIYAVGDLGSSLVRVRAGLVPSPGVLDAIYLTAKWCLALGGWLFWMKAPPHAPAAPFKVSPPPSLFRFLPYLGVIAGYAVLGMRGGPRLEGSLGDVFIGSVSLTVLVLTRQALVLRENKNLVAAGSALTEELRRSEGRFRSLVQNAHDGIVLIAADGRIRYDSPAVERILGYPAHVRLGKPFLDYLHEEDRAAAQRTAEEVTRGPEGLRSIEVRTSRADGSWGWIELRLTNLLGDPAVRSVVANYHDVSERKHFEQRLWQQAFHDPLTQLANRARFQERLATAVARSRRHREPAAVLILDLDGFKTINDSLGHAAGDELLVAVGQRLISAVREVDLVARLGGDEFALLLEGVQGQADAVRVAERLLAALEQPLSAVGQERHVRASIGIALGLGDESADELLRNADAALYMAKGRGKGCFAVFTPDMHAKALERLDLEAHLDLALERGELILDYQPIVETAGQRWVGLEALLRWQHPQRGLLSPARFLPMAEETGQIIAIGQWVLREACRQLAAWDRRHPHGAPLFMSLNLSARQFRHAAILDDVAQILSEVGLRPDRLMIEITEAVALQDAEATIRTLRELRKLGVRLAIDDFGTGYSALSYLMRFPVDTLKLDRSFLEGVDRDPNGTAILSGILAFAEHLGLGLVVEGVETEAELAVVRELGCRHCQGFYLGMPMSPEDVASCLGQSGTFGSR